MHGRFCFPGGKLEFGETLKEGSIRETLEETGKLPNSTSAHLIGFLVKPYLSSKAGEFGIPDLVSEFKVSDSKPDSKEIVIVVSNIYEIVEDQRSKVNPVCEFEYFSLVPQKDGLEKLVYPFYGDVLTKENTIPGIFEAIKFFVRFIDELE